MRRLRIRTRLVLGTSLLAAVLLAAALLVARVQTAELLERSAVELARSDLAPFVQDLRMNSGESPDSVSTGVLIVIRSPDGREVVDTAPHDVRMAIPRTAVDDGTFDVDDDEGRSYVVVSDRVHTSEGTWSLWAARDVSSSRSAVSGIDAVFVLTGLALLVLMVLGSLLLVRGALRPVETLRRSAERLGDDALLPVATNDDELARLAGTLNVAVTRVRDAAERERRMVSDAAHELRTPIAGMRAEIELARRHRDDPEAVDARLTAAERSAERLGELATNLLELSRLEEGGGTGSATASELTREVLDAVDRARSRTAGGSVEIDDDVRIERHEERYGVDALSFSRLVDNLVANATHAVGDHGRIVVSLGDPDGLLLRVEDDGPGMPDDFLPQAFERFSRPDRARSRAGGGLGLALVAAIASASGGTARLENLRPGLRAEVRLPRM